MATVKLQDREIKKLKITVTNIKSVLLEKNKELKQVKLSKKRLDNAALQLARKEGKEKSVEAVKKSSPLTSFSEKAGAATGNIIDKIMSFGSIILGGILLNALPGFIKKFNEAWEKIKPFIDGVGSAIKNIVNFFGGITESIKNFLQSMGLIKKVDNSAQKELEKEFGELEKDLNIDVNSLNNEDDTFEIDDEGNVIGGEDVIVDSDVPLEQSSDQSESSTGSDISKMIDSVPTAGGVRNPSNQNQAQFKPINKMQDLVKLNQRTSTGHKTVIVQRQVVEVPVPV